MIYLYIKTHNKTGLKYLGKTTNKNPYSYQGSGTYWKRHINTHGYDVTTQILLMTESKTEIKETGIFFSKLWNVVESNDWANLKEEAGDGGYYPNNSFKSGEVQRRIQYNRVKNGTHNLLSKNRSFEHPRTNKPNIATRNRNLSDENAFRGNVPCVDITGNSIMVPKQIYYNQLGTVSEWQYVHTNSKEARNRRNK